MGGTFMALPEEYRDYFIRNLHDALSGHTSNNVAEAVRYNTKAFVCVRLHSHIVQNCYEDIFTGPHTVRNIICICLTDTFSISICFLVLGFLF